MAVAIDVDAGSSITWKGDTQQNAWVKVRQSSPVQIALRNRPEWYISFSVLSPLTETLLVRNVSFFHSGKMPLVALHLQ